MNKAEKAQRDLEHLDIIYGCGLLDTLLELMAIGMITKDEALNLIESL